eukprot:g3948.t1
MDGGGRISGGTEHSLFVAADGATLSWGAEGPEEDDEEDPINDPIDGRLGHGGESLVNSDVPVSIEALSGVRVCAVSAGSDYSLFLTEDGKAYSCGNGEDGRLGHGNQEDQHVPKLIEALSGVRVRAVSAGEYHSMFLTEDGKVYSCGLGFYSQLGHGNQEDQHVPKLIEALSGVRVCAVSAGYWHSLFLTEDGKVYSCGNGLGGKLGHGNTERQDVPKLIEALSGVRVCAVSAGSFHNLFLTEDGKAYSCGDGSHHRLGHGDEGNQHVPKLIDALSGVRVCAVSAGSSHSLFLTKDGKVYSCGNGEDGQLGLSRVYLYNQPVPKLIEALSGVRVCAASAGYAHSLFLTEDGKIYSCGDGDNHKLGHGNWEGQLVPKRIEALPTKDFVLRLVEHSGDALKEAPSQLRKDREVVLAAVKQNGFALFHADPELKKDREIVLAAIQQSWLALIHADTELKKDREVVLAAVKQNGWALEHADPELKKDREVVLAAVKQNGGALEHADLELKKDREVVLAAVKQNWWALIHADPELKKDREIVLAAVKQNWWALDHADPELKKDREIVMAAVKQDGCALAHADPELKKDREIVLAAVTQKGCALAHADPELKKDREVVLAAMKQNGFALRHADPELKKDRMIVMAVVKQNGTALMFADQELRKDREVVLAAVKQNGFALRHADPELKKDRMIVMAAVKQDGTALMFADQELRKDREVVLAAVTQNGMALCRADPELKKDREIVLAAMKQNGMALREADPELKKDRQIVIAALRSDQRALWYADEELLDDPDVMTACDGLPKPLGAPTKKLRQSSILDFADPKLKTGAEIFGIF